MKLTIMGTDTQAYTVDTEANTVVNASGRDVTADVSVYAMDGSPVTAQAVTQDTDYVVTTKAKHGLEVVTLVQEVATPDKAVFTTGASGAILEADGEELTLAPNTTFAMDYSSNEEFSITVLSGDISIDSTGEYTIFFG